MEKEILVKVKKVALLSSVDRYGVHYGLEDLINKVGYENILKIIPSVGEYVDCYTVIYRKVC